jgi:hypothetical protein
MRTWPLRGVNERSFMQNDTLTVVLSLLVTVSSAFAADPSDDERFLRRWVYTHPDSPSCRSYRYYGARGIIVCKRWRESVEAIAADMGPRPSQIHVLLRRNIKGGYTPSNCYWGKRKEVVYGSNSRRQITYRGKTQTLAKWARKLNITRKAMRRRVNKCVEMGLDPSVAITQRPKIGRPKKR